MKWMDLTLPTPEANLACDEALLELAIQNETENILRFWEPTNYFVVLGYSNQKDKNVLVATCKKANVPILRRISGGGTVLQGPGCLNYSLILAIKNNDAFKNISKTNCHILRKNAKALKTLLPKNPVVEGHSDLTLDSVKFSGNAQSRKQKYLLFHGTFLLSFDLKKVAKFLPVPEIQPDYRKKRKHEDFLLNLNLPSGQIKEAIKQEWLASAACDNVPYSRIEQLVREKYSQDSWNLKF